MPKRTPIELRPPSCPSKWHTSRSRRATAPPLPSLFPVPNQVLVTFIAAALTVLLGATSSAKEPTPSDAPKQTSSGPALARPKSKPDELRTKLNQLLQRDRWNSAPRAAAKVGRPGRWSPVKKTTLDSKITKQQRELFETLESMGYLNNATETIQVTNVVRHDRERVCPGLNFYTSGHRAGATLMTMEGEVLHEWQLPFEAVWPDYPDAALAPGRGYWRHAHLYPNGEVLVIYEGLGIAKLGVNSEIRWAKRLRVHHDLHVMPDGSIYTLTRKGSLPKKQGRRVPALEDEITILDKNGQPVKSVSVRHCLENSRFDFLLRQGGQAADPFHTSSLHVLNETLPGAERTFRSGYVLLSILKQDRLVIVDPNREKVLCSFHGAFRRQHDAQVLPGGHILLFDNCGSPKASRVLEIDPATNETLWSYGGTPENSLYSATCGAVQRLANGNTLITESDNGRALEISEEGEIVWEFYSPHRAGKHGQFVAVLLGMRRVAPSFDTTWLDNSHELPPE